MKAEVEFQTVGWDPFSGLDPRVHLDGFVSINDFDKDLMAMIKLDDKEYTVIKRVYDADEKGMYITAQRRIDLKEFDELYPY